MTQQTMTDDRPVDLALPLDQCLSEISGRMARGW